MQVLYVKTIACRYLSSFSRNRQQSCIITTEWAENSVECATRWLLWRWYIFYKIQFQLGHCPRPHWLAYSAPPDPLVGWGGAYPSPIVTPLDAFYWPAHFSDAFATNVSNIIFFMIFLQFFDLWLLTWWINCRFYHLYSKPSPPCRILRVMNFIDSGSRVPRHITVPNFVKIGHSVAIAVTLRFF